MQSNETCGEWTGNGHETDAQRMEIVNEYHVLC
jgi:hypothetical protein